jgi:hypothetical protein
MTLAMILETLEATWVATLIQESLYAFPVVVGVHILGLTLSVGTLLWVDFRLLGLTLRTLPTSRVYRDLAPWFIAGFATMFVSGAVLFTAYATAAYGNVFFRLKMIALLLAGANALALHFLSGRQQSTWDTAPRPPVSVRIAGLLSVLLWMTVIVAGRMMSYTMFSAP